MAQIHNPIIAGYHPDPSICRVGDTFYLVNSTFEFFPGVPIYTSKNLVDWKLIGHCLTRDSQLMLQNCKPSGGIYAPTIRYHDGVFYMITTNVTGGGNFIIHTTDPAGEWSEPAWIDHEGIDPSIFFDDDGKVYYTGTGYDEEGKQGISCVQIDPMTGERLSERRFISYGNGGRFPEGPHLYKINGTYYLMIAEGGTEYGHSETIFRSDNVWGPYEACPHNPILSNVNEMYNRIQCTGHADICDDTYGNWWLVCLAIRKVPSGQMLHNLGRETFLTAFTWGEDGWPHLVNGKTIQPVIEAPLPPVDSPKAPPYLADDFTSEALHPEWTFVRNPKREAYEWGAGKLVLHGGMETLNDYQPTFLGARQTEFQQSITAVVDAALPYTSSKAGLTAYYSMENHYDLYIEQVNNRRYAVVSCKIMEIEERCARILLPQDGAVKLRIRAYYPEVAHWNSADLSYDYYFEVWQNGVWQTMDVKTVAGLCSETTKNMTFTGTFFGMFAVAGDAAFTEVAIEA